MKLGLITLIFGLLCSFSSFGETTEEEKSTITKSQTREFGIQCGDLEEKDASSSLPDVKLKITATYNSEKENVEILFNDDTFRLEYPLDFEVFVYKFDTTFVKIDGNEKRYVKHRSHLEVFYWIVEIKNDSNKPLAGKLSLAQFVQVTSERNSKHSDRMIQITQLTDQINRLNSERSRLESNIIISDSLLSFLNRITPVTAANQSKFDSWYVENKPRLEDLGINLTNANDIALFATSASAELEILLEKTRDELLVAKDQYSSKIDIFKDRRIYKVTNVSIQFERGFIERIQVSLNYPHFNRQEIFENSYPVGFTSISNYKNMSGIKLFKRTNKYESGKDYEYIYLSDIIETYDNKLDLLTKDYSPGDTTISVSPSSEPIVLLNKESSMYIVDAKTFTDFNGFNEDSPNGLVQIELSREFNLLSYRYQFRDWGNFGFMNYLLAQSNFLKLENKLKGLPLRNQMVIENSTIVSPNYATNLDFKRYESIGLNLQSNLWLFDFPDLKTTFYFDVVGHYGYTPIIDSNYRVNNGVVESGEVKNLDAHNFSFSPKFTAQLFAERRFGMKVSYTWNNTWLFTNNRFKQVLSYSGKGQDLTSLSTNRDAQRHHTVEAFMFFDPNPNSNTGKVFGVARFHFQHRDINTFFPQILLGYAFQLFK